MIKNYIYKYTSLRVFIFIMLTNLVFSILTALAKEMDLWLTFKVVSLLKVKVNGFICNRISIK